MDPIHIGKKEETAEGWRFVAEIGPDHNKIGFSITICKDYWITLTEGKYLPEDLLLRSLQFLLRHEPKTSIMRSFHLKEIQQHFPEYEGYIRVSTSGPSSPSFFSTWHFS